MIDAATPAQSQGVRQPWLDGHMSSLYSLAMKQAGVDKNTKDVAGGEIVRARGAAIRPASSGDTAEGYIEKAGHPRRQL